MLNTILSDVTGILLVGALIFCIMLTFLSIYISKRVVKPIKKLVDAANRYANRDFTPIEIKSRDEIGDLGKKFNEMGYQLKDYISRQKQFVANVSHELRTPLTAIKGYSEYLLEEVKGRTDLEKSIYHLNNESARLAKLVDELLLLSRIDSVKEDFPFEKLNFSLLIKETTEKMLNRAAKYGLIITTDIQQNVFISGDRSKLTQVIVNLLDNAIKFSLPEGHIEVNLSARGNDAVLEITDHGIGIPKDEAPKVLDRFYRASNAAAVSGSGLGLSITKEIVDKHNGSIEIISSVDAGTTAKLSLPELKCN
jgi:signal transduction histidine kinase